MPSDMPFAEPALSAANGLRVTLAAGFHPWHTGRAAPIFQHLKQRP